MTDIGVPAAAAPAPAGAPTHVTQTQATGYQPTTPATTPAPAATPAPTAAPSPIPSQTPAPTSVPSPTASPSATPVPTPQPTAEQKPPEPTKTPGLEQPQGEFKVPDEYKDKPWAAKVKSLDDLYKQIDTLDALKGKKSIAPNLKDATPEEREAFYAQLRGKEASEYQMPTTSVPIPEDTQPAVAKLFMDNGISPTQAEPFLKGYLELREKQIAQYYNPDDFKKSMETAFGPEWEKTTGQVRNTIKGMMNPEDQKALDAIPNHLLGLVYRTLGNTVKAYGIKETDSAHFQGSGKAAPSNVNDVRQGLRDQLSALSMRPHTDAEQQDILTKLNATYENDPRLQQQA